MTDKRGPDRGYAGGAETFTDGRLSAPAALRNRDALTAALAEIAPESGRALEIASGTGEHVIRFAAAMPGLTWQPTDPAPDRRASISAWIAADNVPNVRPPQDLDACARGWSANQPKVDLIFLANLLHLITAPHAETLLSEMAQTLAPGGIAAVYGPFLRDGETTSEGDAAFHARLQDEIPGAGYKDLAWVQSHLTAAGLSVDPSRAMPANNLLLVARAPS